MPTRLEYIFAYFLCIIVHSLSSHHKALRISNVDFFVYFESSFYQFIKSSILLIAVQLFGRKIAPRFLQTESSFQRIPCLQAIARPYSERLSIILLTKTMPNHINRESRLVNLNIKKGGHMTSLDKKNPEEHSHPSGLNKRLQHTFYHFIFAYKYCIWITLIKQTPYLK